MTAETARPTPCPTSTPDLTEQEQDVLDDASTGDVPNAYDGGFTAPRPRAGEPTQRLEETSARDVDWADPDAETLRRDRQRDRPAGRRRGPRHLTAAPASGRTLPSTSTP